MLGIKVSINILGVGNKRLQRSSVWGEKSVYKYPRCGGEKCLQGSSVWGIKEFTEIIGVGDY